MSKSDYLEQKVLDHIYGLAVFTAPANLYVALFDGDPGETGASNEISGNAYARVLVVNTSSGWVRSGSVVSNVGAVTFSAPTPGDWGTVTHAGLFDAVTSGNYYGGAALTTPRATSAGVAVSFAIGAITHTET
jgi:hypothetical protein